MELLAASLDSESRTPEDTISLLHRWAFESICRIFLDAREGKLGPFKEENLSRLLKFSSKLVSAVAEIQNAVEGTKFQTLVAFKAKKIRLVSTLYMG